SEGIYIPVESGCTVYAALRSDGVERLKVDLRVRCGDLTLTDDRVADDCTVEETQAPSANDAWVYRIRCKLDEVHPENGEARPGVALDTTPPRGDLVLPLGPPHPLHLELSVAETSAPRTGPRLFTK